MRTVQVVGMSEATLETLAAHLQIQNWSQSADVLAVLRLVWMHKEKEYSASDQVD